MINRTKCPECKSTAEHLRIEKVIKHCCKCGIPQEFVYHIIKSPVDGQERRIMCDCPEMLDHLAECQPELLRQAGIKVEGK